MYNITVKEDGGVRLRSSYVTCYIINRYYYYFFFHNSPDLHPLSYTRANTHLHSNIIYYIHIYNMFTDTRWDQGKPTICTRIQYYITCIISAVPWTIFVLFLFFPNDMFRSVSFFRRRPKDVLTMFWEREKTRTLENKKK